jgi:hypothetical protein
MGNAISIPNMTLRFQNPKASDENKRKQWKKMANEKEKKI